ncbi:MAG: hypothetical protein ILP19_08170, partial [Oscillospiraceae bacterium]|nr:hypothetical protein [Oscillospiraceae bacterium]
TIDEMLSASGMTARKLYNIDYPDDVDVTVHLYIDGKFVGYALYGSDGMVHDIMFLGQETDAVVTVNGTRLSDHYGMEKTLLPIGLKDGTYESDVDGTHIKLGYADRTISLKLGSEEHKSYTGSVTTSKGALPAGWDNEKLLGIVSLGGTAIQLPCTEEDIYSISGVQLDRTISEKNEGMVGIRFNGKIIGYYKLKGDTVYCLTVSGNTEGVAINGCDITDTENCEKVISEIFGMNVSNYVISFMEFDSDTGKTGTVYSYDPSGSSFSLEILD